MALTPIPTVFSGNPLDRADQMRTDPEIMGTIARQADARYMLFCGETVLAEGGGAVAWQTAGKCKFLPVNETIFLGLDGDAPRYAAMLDGAPEDYTGLFDYADFTGVRSLARARGSAHPELGIVAQAKSMLAWHANHGFCAKCGHKTVMVKAGYERQCPGCEASHFPRTDPVVIMLAFHEGKALVGRGPKIAPGYFSALAGFMEPGETIEEAVARELYEEAEVKATKVRYVTNQPWPWPSSLMIGCFAWVESDKVVPDGVELDEARWISKEEAIEGLTGNREDFKLPFPAAIAHTLIQTWLAEDEATF